MSLYEWGMAAVSVVWRVVVTVCSLMLLGAFYGAIAAGCWLAFKALAGG
jgi:hypothetical protein